MPPKKCGPRFVGSETKGQKKNTIKHPRYYPGFDDLEAVVCILLPIIVSVALLAIWVRP
jgi:hypothetical protein